MPVILFLRGDLFFIILRTHIVGIYPQKKTVKHIVGIDLSTAATVTAHVLFVTCVKCMLIWLRHAYLTKLLGI